MALEKHGDLMPAVTLESIARNKVALKSPLTTPVGGFTSINVSLRRHFDLYANVRPAHTFPNTKSRFDNVDLITVRENTEGAYLAEGQKCLPTARPRSPAPASPARARAHRALRLRAGQEHRPQEGHRRAQGQHHQVDLGPVPERRP